MSHDVQLEMRDGIAVFRPQATVSLDQAIEWVKSAIVLAREREIARLLVVTSGLEGFEPPEIGIRHFLAREWATASDGRVLIAVVARPEMIDPERFGVTVAANFGVTTRVFDNEADALAWLHDA